MAEIPYTDGILQSGAEARDSGPFLAPTRERMLRVSWAFIWPQFVMQLLFAIAGHRVSNRMAAHGFMTEHLMLMLVALLLLFCFWAAVLLGSMAYALRRSYQEFRVALFPTFRRDGVALPWTFRRVGRVTWEYFWIALVYDLILGIVFVYLPVEVVREIFGLQSGTSTAIQNVLSTALSAVITYYVLKNHIFDRRIGDAQVRLVRRDAESALPQANAAVGPAVS